MLLPRPAGKDRPGGNLAHAVHTRGDQAEGVPAVRADVPPAAAVTAIVLWPDRRQ